MYNMSHFHLILLFYMFTFWEKVAIGNIHDILYHFPDNTHQNLSLLFEEKNV